ncbi:hypothetical protein THRCLA_07002 [Thraustotheca clavata]|uniref:Uncharacterized protein n=1 Tax=Thraustotheca clavata TaxID=74557 RepID=A0A1V9ZHA9_9STRA|nr:hypothetical protein THRCLA_07002 [Thraustotheca clavata]
MSPRVNVPEGIYVCISWLYVAVSITFSAYVLWICTPYMDNGSFWPNFHKLDTIRLLGAILNNQYLLTNTSTANIDLLTPSSSIWRLNSIGVNPVYPRMLQYEYMTTLSSAIQGLRNLAPEVVAYMQTPYCWVDLERRWVLAHTKKRLKRCEKNDKVNGAVYLETVLRNIDVPSWLAIDGQDFYLKIANNIFPVSEREVWLSSILQSSLLPLADEIRYWQLYNISHFTLQYTNRVQIGLDEYVAIQNVFGSSYYLHIKSIPAMNRGASWTSVAMYQGLKKDFAAVSSNFSLILESSSSSNISIASLVEKYSIGTPLNRLSQLLHDSIGPLGNIDLRWIPVPQDLLQAVKDFNANIFNRLHSDTNFYTAFSSIDDIVLLNVPYKWQHNELRFLTGNPMCTNGAPMPVVQSAFGFDHACGTQITASINFNPFSTLFSLHMINRSIEHICPQVPTQLELCHQVLPGALSAYDMMFQDKLSSPIISLSALNLSKVQAVLNGSALILDTIQLIGEMYDFFGWLNIYEWAMNMREAVSLEGDITTLNLLSYGYVPVAHPTTSTTINSDFGLYLWYVSVLVTATLTFVAILLFLLWLDSRPELELGVFNRVASSAWMSRSLLFARSMTAMVCLSTVPIEPAKLNVHVTHLSQLPRSIFDSALLSSDAAWFSYIGHEVLYPFTQKHTASAATFGFLLALITTTLLDFAQPVNVYGEVKRDCYSVNMDWQLYCTSVKVDIGSYYRLVTLALIQFGSIILGIILGIYYDRRRSNSITPVLPVTPDRPVSLLFHASVQAYLKRITSPNEIYDNIVVAAMMGLFPYKRNGCFYIFDVGRWLSYSSDTMMRESTQLFTTTGVTWSESPTTSSLPKLKPSKMSRIKMIWLCVGFSYLVVTLSSNIAYFNVVVYDLANDYGWAGYNATGMQAFLANTYNKYLLFVPSTQVLTPLPLDENTIGDWTQLYNDSTATVTWSEGSARRQLYGQTNQLSQVITDLRNMNPCNLPWVSTQYCWLDFNQTWAMAATAARQSRCDHHMYMNGAVYLESSLRNMNDWVAFESCWGHSFDVGFVQHIQSSLDGQIWLRDVRTNTNSIEEEVAFWHRHQITTYVLQWQNYKTLGMTDMIRIQSALGLSYPLLLSQMGGAFHVKQQTSYKLYWSLASDLWAIGTNETAVSGLSLVSSSPLFAFMNETRLGLLLENSTMVSPLNNGFVIFEETVGPFGAVDSYYVNCPASLLQYYSMAMGILTSLNLNNASAQRAFFDLSFPGEVRQLPTALNSASKDLQFNGGNILCGTDVPSRIGHHGLYLGFNSLSMCHAVFTEVITRSASTQVLAFVAMMASTMPSPNTADLKAICGLDVFQLDNCIENHEAILNYLFTYFLPFLSNVSEATVARAMAEVEALNVVMIQYVIEPQTNISKQYEIVLLDTNDLPWLFYGWCMLFDWVVGAREVITFVGDIGNITVISAQAKRLAWIQMKMPFLKVFLSYVCTVSNTSLLLLRLSPLNLFCINRVVGLVWVGRPLIFLRSLTAIWLLNTSPLALVIVGEVTCLTSPPLEWYKTILASSELTWFVYVLNDFGSCITDEYTYSYSYPSSNWTLVLATLWTFLRPQKYSASIQRKCSAVDVDFALYCTSGMINLGGNIRIIDSMGLVVCCVIICYLYQRLRYPKMPHEFSPPLLLNAQGYHLLSFADWKYRGKYYIDKTTAIMAGILSFKYDEQLFILDIKTWRFLSIETRLLSLPPVDTAHEKFQHTIPLHI